MRVIRCGAPGWVVAAMLLCGVLSGCASLPPSQGTDEAIARIRDAEHTPVPNPIPNAIPGSIGEGLVVENKTGYTLNLYLKGPVTRTIVLKDREFSAVALVPGSYEIAAETVEAKILPFYSRQMYQGKVRYTLTFSMGTPVR
jgi:hypothetical protein